MSDIEFEILDELYFVIPYHELRYRIALPEEVLVQGLQEMIKKGWVRFYKNNTDEVLEEDVNFTKNYKNYYYLASKAGLLAHNSI
ncbi:hypothetical protein BH23BAC1_BH23BAC1_03890 [soil metagenome]